MSCARTYNALCDVRQIQIKVSIAESALVCRELLSEQVEDTFHAHLSRSTSTTLTPPSPLTAPSIPSTASYDSATHLPARNAAALLSRSPLRQVNPTPQRSITSPAVR